MGMWAWIVLLAVPAAIATVAQMLLFSRDRKPTDNDWVFIAGGALVGGFTGHAWYPGVGPTFDGLNVYPAVAGIVVGATLAELAYRLVLRPRRG